MYTLINIMIFTLQIMLQTYRTIAQEGDFITKDIKVASVRKKVNKKSEIYCPNFFLN